MSYAPYRVGILGGGQLAQMLALAARQLGVIPYIFVRNKLECAAQVTSHVYIDDGTADTFREFLKQVDVITIENEFIHLEQIQKVLQEVSKTIYPSIENLQLVQSKLDQKNFLIKNKISTLKFLPLRSVNLMDEAWTHYKGKLVIKKARFGYDGRGTFIFNGIKEKESFDKLKTTLFSKTGENLLYAEELADFKKELAVIIVRSKNGEIASYPTIETFQEKGMCVWAQAPAQISATQNKMVQKLARDIITKLKGVGTFGIEMFLLKSGKIVINEIAPRVHNSGHLTMNSCSSSQFEQHLRAVLGMPLGSTKLNNRGAAMINLIGSLDQLTPMASKIPSQSDSWIHWYGKSGQTKGRKLGHINTVGSSPKEALKKALSLRKKILI